MVLRIWNQKFLQWTVVILQATLQWGKKDEPVYVTEESGVVGLNFHQSKEVLIQDNANGHYDVSNWLLFVKNINNKEYCMPICFSFYDLCILVLGLQFEQNKYFWSVICNLLVVLYHKMSTK